MPKAKKDRVTRVLRQMKSEESFKVFEYHDDGVYCNVCASVLTSVTSWTLSNHLEKIKHKTIAKLKLSQLRITTAIQDQQEPTTNFAHDLVETFISADIPLYKLGDPKIKWLFETYAKEKLPSVNYARTRHLKKIYEEKVLKMQQSLAGHELWVSQYVLFFYFSNNQMLTEFCSIVKFQSTYIHIFCCVALIFHLLLPNLYYD